MDDMTEALREFILSKEISSEVICLKWNIDHEVFMLRLKRLRKTGMDIRQNNYYDGYDKMDLE